jgi:hypothetical protein
MLMRFPQSVRWSRQHHAVVGIRRHLREASVLQELIDDEAHSVHRQAGSLLDDSQCDRVRSDVFVTAELDEFEDEVVVGLLCHAAAMVSRNVFGIVSAVSP